MARDTYAPIKDWKDKPDKTTPIFAEDMKRIEQGIKDAMDNRALKEIYDDTAISLGRIGNVGTNSYAVGNNVVADQRYAHAEGDSCTANEASAHAEGHNTHATGAYSHTEGDESTASKTAAHAEGYKSHATGSYSHAEGAYDTNSSGDCSHAEGYTSVSSGNTSHAEGYHSTASGDYSHSEGYYTESSGNTSHAEGYYSKAKGYYCHAEGEYCEAGDISSYSSSSYCCHAEGMNTKAVGYCAHAEGYYTTANAFQTNVYNPQHVEGRYNILDSKRKYSHIVGNGNADNSRSNAHTLDWDGVGWFKKDVQCGSTEQDSGETISLVDLSTRLAVLEEKVAALTQAE